MRARHAPQFPPTYRRHRRGSRYAVATALILLSGSCSTTPAATTAPPTTTGLATTTAPGTTPDAGTTPRTATTTTAGRTTPTPAPDAITVAGRDTAWLTANLEQVLSTYRFADRFRAVIVQVAGTVVFEKYWQTTATDTHNVFSVTKSVISALVGVALAEGKLPGLDASLDTLLPAYAASMSPEVAAITLGELLTMTAGLPEAGDAGTDFSTQDWIQEILDIGLDHPTGTFAYSDAGPQLLSAVLREATGVSVLDYARATLFDPLGIDTAMAVEGVPVAADAALYEQAGFAWPNDPAGNHLGYSLLKMTPRDMLTIGELYLGGGAFDGRQLLPPEWVAASTSSQVTAKELGPKDSYGYLWWVTQAAGDPAFAAVGFGGQLIEVVPERRLVVVVASALPDTPGVARVESAELINLVSSLIAPAAAPS